MFQLPPESTKNWNWPLPLYRTRSMLPLGWWRRIMPARLDWVAAKRTRPVPSAVVAGARVWKSLEEPRLVMRPSSDETERPEPDVHAIPSEAVPQPLWL